MQATERAELDAMRDLYVALDSSCEVGDAVCGVVQRLPESTMLNRALGVGLDAPATEEQLDEIVAAFAGRGCVCAVAVAPEAQPAELPAWLRARGFEPGYAWMKFSRRVGDPRRPSRPIFVSRRSARSTRTRSAASSWLPTGCRPTSCR
jgi:hypothetical protein